MSLHSDAATVPADAQAAGNSVSHANAYLLYRLIVLYRLFPSLSTGNLLRIKILEVNTASVNRLRSMMPQMRRWPLCTLLP